MWAAGFLGVGAWWAWYALVRYNQRRRHAREVQIASHRGLPLPDPPQAPNVFNTWIRVNSIGALAGIGLAAIALAAVALGNCGSR
jgi:hypothetical protein